MTLKKQRINRGFYILAHVPEIRLNAAPHSAEGFPSSPQSDESDQ
jgi:hypothetical protein